MSVSRSGGAFEWSSSSVFAQWSNFFRPSFWRMLFDIVRFNLSATSLLQSVERDTRISIGDYLTKEGYSPQFGTNYLLPITASIWGIDVDTCRREFPIITLVQFL
jgi:predicted NAD/FAD-binding protein